MKPGLNLKPLRWLFIPAGIGLILVCLLPGEIIVDMAIPSRMLRTQAWMHPFVWPMIGLGILFIAAPFSEKLRKKILWITTSTGFLSLIILYGIESFIRKELLEFWLNTSIANMDNLDVEVSLLPLHFVIAILLIIVPIIYSIDKKLYAKWKHGLGGPTK